MNRDEMLDRLRDDSRVWDVLVIGGGATGVGVAVDAASRGYTVALVEQSDFGKGTSSRSTKLIHGGVRYLEQGTSLVREALHERTILRRNAPHVVKELPLVLPTYRWGQRTFYGAGLKLYDWLAGDMRMQRSRWLSKADTIDALPTVNPDGLRGGVMYCDGQFDDARLLINLVQTAAEHGAAMANYCQVASLLKDTSDKVNGALARDLETDAAFNIQARVVVNATGAFVDDVRRMDDSQSATMIAPSQGIHVVLDRHFLPGESALLVPKTRDGRVLFAIPWHGRVLAGTTDRPISEVSLEPRPMEQEIDFVLETLGDYLTTKPTRDDIRSTFAGIRPLVKRGGGKSTAKLSRDHTIEISDHRLLTITGGKWTTYRYMAEDCVNQAAKLGELEDKPCITSTLPIHGHCDETARLGERWYYGSDAEQVDALSASEHLSAPLHDRLPYESADVVWAVRHEMARTIDDVLSRRTRALLLDARAAIDCTEDVALNMSRELNRDESWRRTQVEQFLAMANGYLS